MDPLAGTRVSAVSHTTLAESVAATLRHAIQNGEYLCGDRLVELTLAHEMNVSPTTVRDAFRLLEQEGWIVKRPRLGSIVRTFTRDEAHEVYVLWATLEGLALGRAMMTMTDADGAQLKAILSRANRCAQTRDWKEAQESIFAFHSRISELSARSQTAALLARLHNQARLLETLREQRAPRGFRGWQSHLAGYNAILQHILSGNATAARQSHHDHLMTDCATLLECL